LLVVDGANVGCAFGSENGRRAMLHAGMRERRSCPVAHTPLVPLCTPTAPKKCVHCRPGVFCARGVWLCVDFWRRQGVDSASVAVTLNENRWDPSDPELIELDRLGVLNWAPSRKDDDLFTINLANDQEAFVVTKDAFRNYQMHVTSSLKRRIITYWFAGSGGHKEHFGVSEADCARVRQAVRHC